LTLDPSLAPQPFCYLTTVGRVTGRPHQIEIWFGLAGNTAYLLAGDHSSDWVLNLRKHPSVNLRIREHSFDATARIVTDPEEDIMVRRLLMDKYGSSKHDLSGWGRTALPVALDLQP